MGLLEDLPTYAIKPPRFWKVTLIDDNIVYRVDESLLKFYQLVPKQLTCKSFFLGERDCFKDIARWRTQQNGTTFSKRLTALRKCTSIQGRAQGVLDFYKDVLAQELTCKVHVPLRIRGAKFSSSFIDWRIRPLAQKRSKRYDYWTFDDHACDLTNFACCSEPRALMNEMIKQTAVDPVAYGKWLSIFWARRSK